MPDINPGPTDRPPGAADDGQHEAGEAVATGDRRQEMRYEDDPAQLARVRHTFVPDHPLPPQEHSAAVERGTPLSPDVTDVAEVKPSPSVWDARPPEG